MWPCWAPRWGSIRRLTKLARDCCCHWAHLKASSQSGKSISTSLLVVNHSKCEIFLWWPDLSEFYSFTPTPQMLTSKVGITLAEDVRGQQDALPRCWHQETPLQSIRSSDRLNTGSVGPNSRTEHARLILESYFFGCFERQTAKSWQNSKLGQSPWAEFLNMSSPQSCQLSSHNDVLGWAHWDDFFFKTHAHQHLWLMWKVRSLLIRPPVVHTIKCYQADEVLEQGTFLKDRAQRYCHCMRVYKCFSIKLADPTRVAGSSNEARNYKVTACSVCASVVPYCCSIDGGGSRFGTGWTKSKVPGRDSLTWLMQADRHTDRQTT